MPGTDPNPVEWDVREGIGHLILSAPPSNAMTLPFFECLERVVEEASAAGVEGVIVCGEGRHFSAGAEISELLAEFGRLSRAGGEGGWEDQGSVLSRNTGTFLGLEGLGVPVVAAIRGLCLGSGLELALCAHFRVCEQRATLGLPESTFDLLPGCGGTVRLPERVGFGQALQLILSGETLGAEDALACGVVDVVVPPRTSLRVAQEFIRACPGTLPNRARGLELLFEIVSRPDLLS